MLLARFHGLFPGLTADLLSFANRLVLPAADERDARAERGMEVRERARSRVHSALTGMGLSAAERFHQYPGPAHN
jgi:hypothetical protein